jgi:pimeloyl-ACP methyl ester carboxylesterase
MRIRLSRLAVLAPLFLAALISPVFAADKIGIVLVHGKLGANLGVGIGEQLMAALTSSGYLVTAPEMCWSKNHGFDKPYPECLAALDGSIASLKSQGATQIVIAGLSLGGNAVIAYGATHPGLLGIIGMGPADDLGRKSKRPDVIAGLAKAQGLIAAGKGDEKTLFDDTNTGRAGSFTMQLDTTPNIYLSFNGPDARTNIPANVAKLTAPLLWIAGSEDPTQRGAKDYAFAKAPPNPLNRFVEVDANHLDTPDAGKDAILAWLKDLQTAH